jgi:hypothetical protein
VSPCFFDVHDGDHLSRYSEGIELPDLQAAKVEAQSALPDIARDELPDSDRRDLMVSVRADTGQVVLRATLSPVVVYLSFDRPEPIGSRRNECIFGRTTVA